MISLTNKMKKIIAIGGGEIGRPGHPIETSEIDKEIIRRTDKQKPNLLFIPTASSDSEGYVQVITDYFGKKLGCEIDVLYLIKEKPTKIDIERKVFRADIIYVGGGNTLKMMKVWRACSLDKILLEAHKKGIILSGVSAGAVCWFKYANSDSRKSINPEADYIKVKGLNLINALYCPHYNFEKERKAGLKIMMKKTAGIALAFDNCTAIEIIADKYRILSSKNTANAYKVYWKKGKFYEQKIEKTEEFSLLEELLKK